MRAVKSNMIVRYSSTGIVSIAVIKSWGVMDSRCMAKQIEGVG